jgi:endoglucanase
LLLKELSEAFGVSGHEEAVRKLIQSAIQDRIDEQRVDTLGNLIAVKKGASRSPRKVMIAAHMDEVGLMIMHIEKDGWLRFHPVGGIDPRILLAKKVLIGDDRVPGVIGVAPIHLLDAKARNQVLKIRDLAIDIGVSSKEDAERKVKRGDYATFDVTYEELGGEWSSAKGKALDDRAGCAALIELLHERYPFDLYAAFTVQEEIGARGARVAAHAIAPDVALVLEGTICDDTPKKRDVSPTTALGAGPAITLMDRSMIADRRLVRLLADTAAEQGIDHQFKQPGRGGTDAGVIHLSREGVPSAVVSVPVRNLHSPVSIMSLNDLRGMVRLLRASLYALNDLDLSR